MKWERIEGEKEMRRRKTSANRENVVTQGEGI